MKTFLWFSQFFCCYFMSLMNKVNYAVCFPVHKIECVCI